jgi:hypothetical protein
MNIHLHIEHLVLDRLPLEAAHDPAVQAAVEAELMRLLGEDGLAPGFRQRGALAYARGSDVHLASASVPDALGRQIGGAIYHSLRP